MDYNLTRIAPTPSGFLHLGNVLSFSVTAAIARRSGAEILLRIDDLDRGRAQREYVEDIFETLRFMEIPWDRGPLDYVQFEREYSQVHRLSLYHDALSQLRSSGAVFGCSCSRAEVLRASRDGGYPGTCRERGLSLDGVGVSWRLATGVHDAGAGACACAGADVDFDAGACSGADADFDAGARSGADSDAGACSGADSDADAGLPAEMRDFVVRKKDGFPAYQLSSVVDDLHYGVNLVVRGQDLWASTQAQLYLAGQLGSAAFQEIAFFHHPLLTAGDGEKLSKSAGAMSIQYLRSQGMKAPDVYALIARRFLGDTFSGNAFSGDAFSGDTFSGDRADFRDVRDWARLAALVLAHGDRRMGAAPAAGE